MHMRYTNVINLNFGIDISMYSHQFVFDGFHSLLSGSHFLVEFFVLHAHIRAHITDLRALLYQMNQQTRASASAS